MLDIGKYFIITPYWMFHVGNKLTKLQWKILAILLNHVDEKTYSCYLPKETIATELGRKGKYKEQKTQGGDVVMRYRTSNRDVNDSIRRMKHLGLIDYHYGKKSEDQKCTTVYTLKCVMRKKGLSLLV